MDDDGKKPEDAAAEPAYDGPQDEGFELRDVSEEELKQILEAHKKWCETDRMEGERADLGNANLQGVDLAFANLHGAGVWGANLQGAHLVGTNFQGANLSGANLQGANFLAANLQGADLGGAKLQEATLLHAKFQNANLNANLQGTNLTDANLQGANLVFAENLTREQLDQACGDDKTKLPDDLADYQMKPCPPAQSPSN